MFAIILTVGLVMIQLNMQTADAFLEEENYLNAGRATPTKTPTPISFDFGPGGYLDRRKAIITMLARATGSPSINYICGRLQIVIDTKTNKDVLVLEPCLKGSYYVFKVRPDELHSYYQLMNVRIQNGEEVYTKEFGILTKYITNFSGYYVLENCQGCGIKPVFISTAEIIFPTSTGIIAQPTIFPTMPPFPTQKEIASLSTSTPIAGGPTVSPNAPLVSSTSLASSATQQESKTAESSNAVYLTLMDLKIEPVEPIQNQESILHVTIQNLGFPIGKLGWDYSGKVLLKSNDGKVLEELEFARDQSSSIAIVDNTRVQAETWEITIPVHFSQSIQNGEVEVYLQPLDYLTYIYPRSVKTTITVLDEAAPTTPMTDSTPQAVVQPAALQTETAPVKPSACKGWYAALLIPVAGVIFLWTRSRRTS